MQHQTLLAKIVQKSIYSNRAVIYNRKYYCDCSIKVHLDLLACMFYACKCIAAGDYPSSNLMC